MRNACLEIAADITETVPRHPAGPQARVLLTSVFGPYAQDDEYGSRTLNPMELYHNQVTRTQGPFSLRMFHRSWGLMLIQANLEAPCTVLDFPSRERFIEELQQREYDVIGISSIISNQLKVRAMCQLIRHYQPQAQIVIGGHIANLSDLDARIDADFIVRGDGVRWMRVFLGQDADSPIRHPLISSGFTTRSAGVAVRESPEDVAATLIPSVGCPLGCNFCSTSAMFGGKGKFVDFYHTGDELFDVMCQLEAELGVQAFFVMDENFLLHRRRALRLLERMEEQDKSWALYVFSSANVLRSYSIEQLVGLGVSWVWMGLEGESSRYSKLHGTDTRQLVRQLQSHGIRVLGSTIIGLEEHTPENMDRAIEYAVGHDTDFHQFMLYTPLAGTPLHAELSAAGRMKPEGTYEVGDIHGQLIFNYRHAHIPEGAEAGLILRAFERDFAVNGPSTVRIVRTTLAGWRRYQDHPNPRIRRRFAAEAGELPTTFAALVSAARLYFRGDPQLHARLSGLLNELYREFGWKARLAGAFGGRWLLRRIRREQRRLQAGWTREPDTFYERNASVNDNPAAQLCRSVLPRSVCQGARRPAPTRREPVAV